jgi:hypothetical protein
MRLIAAAAASLLTAAVAFAEDKGTPVEIAGLKSTAPADWKSEKPSNEMRIYQFKLPKEKDDKDDADLVVFFFKSGSGTVEQNLKRQVAKFNPADGKDKVEEKVEKIKVGTIEATYQDVSGTFIKKASPMATDGTPMPGYRQLYVVFESKDHQYYMTLLGPAKTVEKHKKAFEEWLKNFK